MKDKKLAMVVWLFFALVFVGLLGFLFFASTGLKVSISPLSSSDLVEVAVSNESRHIIHQVSVVELGEEKKAIASFDSMKPYEIRTIQIPFAESRITVQASAPFHVMAEDSRFVAVPEPLDVTVTVPPNLKLNEPFEIKVRVCSHAESESVTIEEQHDSTFFEKENQVQQLSVSKSACQEAAFEFDPQFSGPTTILFNIKSDNDTGFSKRRDIIIGK